MDVVPSSTAITSMMRMIDYPAALAPCFWATSPRIGATM
jgi:hypothetical protein